MSPKVTREAYAAVYISAPWHRKVLAIPESDRVAAFGFYAATLALCQSYRNDGHLPAEQLAAVIACPDSERKRLTDALTAVHLFDKTPAGIQVHDFLDHNSSREEIEAAHSAMREGGRRGGVRSGQARAGSPTSKATFEGSTERSSAEIAVKRSAEASRAEARSAEASKAPDPECPICKGSGKEGDGPCWCTV